MLCFSTVGEDCLLQTVQYIPQKNIECTRCHQILPIKDFPPEYVLRNKPHPLCRKCKKERQQALREKWKRAREARKDLPTEKECRGCHRFKPISEYNISINYKDGFHSHCKSCVIKKTEELKQRWKKERKNIPPPKEKLCTQCYHVFPISHFCSNIRSKDGFDHTCKDCLKSRRTTYSNRWMKERKVKPPKQEKTCPGCQKTLPISEFYAHKKLKDGLNNYCRKCTKRMRQEYMDTWEKQRKTTKKTPETKECILCHRHLPLKKFYKNRIYKDGYSSSCIKCEKQRSREYIEQWQKEGTHGIEEKQCQACKRILPADQFVKNKRKKDGLAYLCRECSRQLREEYSFRWSEERKQKVKDEFSLYPSFEKTCSVCHQTKPLSMFYTRKHTKDGHSSSCKECDRKRERKYHERLVKQPKIVPENKLCTSCNRLLPASEFNKCNQRKDGLFIYCKDCQNKKYKDYRNRPEVKKKLKEWTKNYLKKPEVREKTRKRARKYYNQPHVKAKAATYRKKHRAKPEVKRQRQEYSKKYYKRKKGIT